MKLFSESVPTSAVCEKAQFLDLVLKMLVIKQFFKNHAYLCKTKMFLCYMYGYSSRLLS